MSKTTSFAAAIIWVASCAIGASDLAYGQHNPVDRLSNPAGRDFTDVSIAPREMSPPFVRDGIVTEPRRFAAIAQGLEQAQVLSLLGTPVSQRGQEWDYNFQFKMEQSANYIVCQYKVVFDEKQRVRETVWRRRQCQQLASTSSAQ